MRKISRVIIIISSFICIISCQSIKKSFDNRDYDSVVAQFLKQKNFDDNDLAMFEKSYNAVLERDKQKIEKLKELNNGDRWEEIFDLYSKMNARQNEVIRLLPVYYTNGEEANIETLNLSIVLEESRQNAAQSYYDQGLKLLNTGVKSSIRQSVDYFNASKKFYINYKDVNELIDQALAQGKNYVLLLVEKNPALFLPPSFEQSILNTIRLSPTNQWLTIDYQNKSNIAYDYVVKLNLYDVQVSPDALKEINTTEEKTIADGWQYVLDNNGNVKKDSLGNDIKIPKYKKISCQVKETRMNKSAQVFGDVTIYDARTKSTIKNQKCLGNSLFNYSYFQVYGNRDALSYATLKKLGNPPGIFPNTIEMVERSKEELIKCYQDFIQSNYNMLVYTK